MSTKFLKEKNNVLYCVIPSNDRFYVEEKAQDMEYDIAVVLKELTVEEKKFLIAECIMDDPFLKESVFREGILPKTYSIYALIRTYTEEQLTGVISSIQYTKNFNAYLCYMLNDWVSDNFDSEVERSKYVF